MKHALLGLVLAIGLSMIALSLNDLARAPAASDINRELERIARWPVVEGWLDEVHLQEGPRSKGSSMFSAEVRYRYDVGGTQYEGRRVAIDEYRDRSAEVLESRLRRLAPPFREASRDDVVSGGPILATRRISIRVADQPVAVHYDPDHPESSLLDAFYHFDHGGLVRWAPHLVLIPMGTVLIVVSVLAWRQGPPTRRRPRATDSRARGEWVPIAFEPDAPRPPAGGHDWFDLLQEGRWLLGQGQHAAALAAFERAYSLAPGEAGTGGNEIQMLLGQVECLLALDRRPEARRQLDRVMQELEDRDHYRELRDEAERLRAL
jgi:hypothetical protein